MNEEQVLNAIREKKSYLTELESNKRTILLKLKLVSKSIKETKQRIISLAGMLEVKTK
jgi:hypothetical protein